jgi:hypothetical protein
LRRVARVLGHGARPNPSAAELQDSIARAALAVKGFTLR